MNFKPKFLHKLFVATLFFFFSYGISFAQDTGNEAPTVSGIPSQTIDEKQQFSPIKLDDYVNDPDDKANTITWTVSGQNDLVITINNRVANIRIPDKYWNGSETVTFIAKDPKGATGAETITLTVNSINDPPVVKKIPNQTINEGSEFKKIKLDDYVSDPDHPAEQINWLVDLQQISKEKADGELNIIINENRIASLVQPDTNWFGAYKATFTATDGEGASDKTEAVFTVNPVNDAPILQAIPSQAIDEGQEFEVINLMS